MRYNEYLNCAKKHLKGCYSLLQSYKAGQNEDRHVWLELYYLSGYIIEGIVVYSAYKLNNWPANDDIKRKYNEKFTKLTNLDFYYIRTYKKNGKEIIPSYFQNRPSGALSVQGHRFQDIVKSLLRPNPSFQNTPYLGDGQIATDVESLIDEWKPDIRYSYEYAVPPPPNLSQDLITRLLETCYTIYKQHI